MLHGIHYTYPMSPKLQNLLIGASLLGIFIYFASDVFKKNYNPPTVPKEKVAIVTPVPTEALAECSGPYINIKEGAVWKYKITTTGTNAETVTISTQLTRKSLGRIEFSTANATTGKKVSTEILCKNSGIYGLPIPLFSTKAFDNVPSELISPLTQSVLFIPNKKVYKNKAWSSEIDISSLLPIKTGAYPLAINFNVTKSGEITLPNKKSVQGISISTSSNPQGSIDLSSLFNINYQLGENVGLIDGLITVKIPSKAEVVTKIELISFSSPL